MNGGAQVRPTGGTSAKDLILKLEEMYNSLPCKSIDMDDTQSLDELYDTWLGGAKDGDERHPVLHTTYHAIEKNINALNIKW